MKIELWYIGKTSFPFIDQGIKEFSKRIKRYNPFEERLISDVKSGKKHTPAQIKTAEAHKVMSQIKKEDLLILLDEKGKEFDSIAFSEKIEHWLHSPKKRIIFLIGGAWGFHSDIYQRADHQLSLSKMTFSHQLIRLIFVEQLYRGFTILKNEKYHNT